MDGGSMAPSRCELTPAAERILDVMERAATWLTTHAIAVRSHLHPDVTKRTLRALLSDEFVERRDDPENNRAAQWRARGPWAE